MPVFDMSLIKVSSGNVETIYIDSMHIVMQLINNLLLSEEYVQILIAWNYNILIIYP